MPEREQRERSLSTLNKVGQFLNDFRLRNIVGQPRSGFDIDDILANRKVFIANLAQGELGIGKSRLLGALLIVCFHLAALRRRDRTPFHIAVDEFHSFGASTFAEMLSGIRKYGVSLTLANQYVDQLAEPLRAALFGTVGSIVAFRIGVAGCAVAGTRAFDEGKRPPRPQSSRCFNPFCRPNDLRQRSASILKGSPSRPTAHHCKKPRCMRDQAARGGNAARSLPLASRLAERGAPTLLPSQARRKRRTTCGLTSASNLHLLLIRG